ncbi:MAG: HAD hydrolase-like protein [Blastocatellia bacterium]
MISNHRKPSPGMILTAFHEHQINLLHSIIIGDKESDKIAAYRAGVGTYLDATSFEWPVHPIKVIRA